MTHHLVRRHVTGAAIAAAIVGVTAFVLPTPLHAQSRGSIAGRVVTTDSTPVVGAIVSVDGTRVGTQTGVDGRFRLGGIDAGAHTVHARRAGLVPASQEVDVRSGATTQLSFTLRDEARALEEVTIIGSRSDLVETRDRMARVPGAVALVTPLEIRSTRQANIKDVLSFTPGVYVQPRFGAADESQLSIRGSGLRNNFHARGVNLLVNGMPYRNADGFTDFESLEMLTTQAIEVYKGANALRYGGSTLGGAINFDTKTGDTAPVLSLFGQGGSYGFHKLQVASGDVFGNFDYYASYARTSLDNYRAWSDQQRDRVNLHVGQRLTDRLDARAFYFYAHVNEHLPGALTRSEFDVDPRQAVAANVSDRWGREYDLHHVGVQLRAQLSPHQRLDISPYAQYRDIDHPIYEVIAQVSRDVGAEFRYENTAPLGGMNNRFTLGAQPAYEHMDNRQFVNEGGRHGAATRDELDKVINLGIYAENALSLTDRLTAVAGFRIDRSRRSVDDDFLSNGDQSAERVYRAVTPRFGLLYEVAGMGGAVFANASRTVEPPLLLEMSSFGNPGGFIDLDAQRAWQYELGARGRRDALTWEVSLYDIELRDEILNINVLPFEGAQFTVPTYRNAPRTRHYGIEAGLGANVASGLFAHGAMRDHLTARMSYTYGRFTYVDDSTFSGNDIPGAPRHYLMAELRYAHPSGVTVTPHVEWVPRAFHVNSDNSVQNGAWSTLGVRAEWTIPSSGVTAFAEARNLFDRTYSASVQVDNAAGRFYEPAEPRSVLAGLRWSR